MVESMLCDVSRYNPAVYRHVSAQVSDDAVDVRAHDVADDVHGVALPCPVAPSLCACAVTPDLLLQLATAAASATAAHSAANAALVHAFMQEGMRCTCVSTSCADSSDVHHTHTNTCHVAVSPYPLYGSRSAEDRLRVLRSVLYDACHVDVHVPRVCAATTRTPTLPVESREHYWRRLARYYIDRGFATAAAAGTAGVATSTTAAAAAVAASLCVKSTQLSLASSPCDTLARTTATVAPVVVTPCTTHGAASARMPAGSPLLTTTTTATATAALPRAVGEPEDAFYVIDLGRVVEQMARWRACLPMVRPFYAVKCNPNMAILRTLAALGAGFDCASRAEIDLVLDHHLVSTSDDIVFANPCKQVGDLRAAAARGVTYVTFDSTGELDKIAQHMPDARALLRLRTDDRAAVCAFSSKFGAALEDVEALLQHAVARGVELYGVSFHVGSGNSDASAYVRAVRDAHAVFELAARYNYNCTILDIGGGYPGTPPAPQHHDSSSTTTTSAVAVGDDDAAGHGSGHAAAACSFEDIAAALRPVLTSLFADTTIIAEPGRYFTAATHALAMHVFGKRIVRMTAATVAACRRDFPLLSHDAYTCSTTNTATTTTPHDDDDDDKDKKEATAAVCGYEHQYYVNDGLYHSFNCILYDHAHPTLLLLDHDDNNSNNDSEQHVCDACTTAAHTPTTRPLRISTIFGPTCDSLDCIVKQRPLPEMRVGDWLLVPDMGSYTTAAGCAFNGFATRRVEYVSSIDV